MASGALKREAGGCTYAHAQVWLESLSRHSWLESPFTTFLSLSLFILDHSHNAESYAGNVDSDMPPTRGSDALFFGNLDDPHSRSLNHSLTSPDTKSAKLSPSPLSHSHATYQDHHLFPPFREDVIYGWTLMEQRQSAQVWLAQSYKRSLLRINLP